ncbi:MAG: stage III sporulation protein AF [Acetatifactor sp.]|nr:stage III sporulation protein AF [Acetatifactor sp.]
MQWLYRVVGQAGIFLICAQTIVHFRPKETYEKYLKLLLSVMLLTQLLQPALTAFSGGEEQNVQAQVEEFTEEMQSVLNRASERAKQSQEDIGNTAAAVVQEAGEAPEGKPTEQKKTGTENAEDDGIHVEIPQVRLE